MFGKRERVDVKATVTGSMPSVGKVAITHSWQDRNEAPEILAAIGDYLKEKGYKEVEWDDKKSFGRETGYRRMLGRSPSEHVMHFTQQGLKEAGFLRDVADALEAAYATKAPSRELA